MICLGQGGLRSLSASSYHHIVLIVISTLSSFLSLSYIVLYIPYTPSQNHVGGAKWCSRHQIVSTFQCSCVSWFMICKHKQSTGTVVIILLSLSIIVIIVLCTSKPQEW